MRREAFFCQEATTGLQGRCRYAVVSLFTPGSECHPHSSHPMILRPTPRVRLTVRGWLWVLRNRMPGRTRATTVRAALRGISSLIVGRLRKAALALFGCDESR